MRYSKTTKFLHLVHKEIRWRQDSTVLAAVRTAGASTVCKEGSNGASSSPGLPGLFKCQVNLPADQMDWRLWGRGCRTVVMMMTVRMRALLLMPRRHKFYSNHHLKGYMSVNDQRSHWRAMPNFNLLIILHILVVAHQVSQIWMMK